MSAPNRSTSLPGYLLIGYGFFCLGLVFSLSHHSPSTSTAVPAPTVEPLPDFAAFKNTSEKKRAFFNYLRPAIDRQNRQLRHMREWLQSQQRQLNAGKPLTPAQLEKLHQLGKQFRLDSTDPRQLVDALVTRADELPAALVLAQAALESAWGTSRFAKEGNNLFGQWCFTPGCGMVPRNRAPGKSHEVQIFSNVGEAIDAYFFNINTHVAYAELRHLRSQARQKQQPLRGSDLAAGLQQYSEQGARYTDKVRTMIRRNQLE